MGSAKGSIDAVMFEPGAGWTAHGWAYDSDRPGERLTVEIVETGRVLGSGRAAVFREDLKAAEIGDGFHAFKFPIRIGEADDREEHLLSLRDRSDGAEIRPPAPFVLRGLLGRIERVEGIVAVGWACDTARPNAPAVIEMLVDGEVAGCAVADPSRAAASNGGAEADHGFAWVLPQRVLDGQPHRLAARFANSRTHLEGSIEALVFLPGQIPPSARRLMDLCDFARQHLSKLEHDLAIEARNPRPIRPTTTAELLLDRLDPAAAFEIASGRDDREAAIGRD
jgi:hypothetical protein